MSTIEYATLYADKKPEDNIIITNMFKNCVKINIGWTKSDIEHNLSIVDRLITVDGINQIIIAGFEIGWDEFVVSIKKKYRDVKVKVICNTNDSLLYYEYERDNFFKLLGLSQNGIVDDIAFFRKGQYEVYKNIGYKCSYVLENFILNQDKKETTTNDDTIPRIGIYPLNYTWDKNIFNQLCIAKFVENSCLNYNNLDERMDDFLSEMKIKSCADRIDEINEESLIKAIVKNDVIVSASFTEYVHPIFFISMELGIPCLIGNNSDFFDKDSELAKYVVTDAEDNAIINSNMVKKMLDNRELINKLYIEWKKEYNQKSQKSIIEFIEK